MPAQTDAERQAKRKARKAASGLVRVEVWVAANKVEQLKKYAERLKVPH